MQAARRSLVRVRGILRVKLRVRNAARVSIELGLEERLRVYIRGKYRALDYFSGLLIWTTSLDNFSGQVPAPYAGFRVGLSRRWG